MDKLLFKSRLTNFRNKSIEELYKIFRNDFCLNVDRIPLPKDKRYLRKYRVFEYFNHFPFCFSRIQTKFLLSEFEKLGFIEVCHHLVKFR